PRSVQIVFSLPQFRGGDGSALQQRITSFAEDTLAHKKREWQECQVPHGVAVRCSPWRIEVECEAVKSNGTLAVVCLHRTTEPEFPALNPSVDYSAFNATSCGGTLRFLDFDKDFCPGWACFDSLRAALVRTGTDSDLLHNEPDFIKRNLANFYLTDDHIVFLGADTREVDPRFPFGVDVIALSYRDLVSAAPGALELLGDLGFAQVD